MVKLVAVTQGAGELLNKTAQDVVSYVARVSNPSNQSNFDTAAKLLAYCIKNNHWSIFEHASLTVEIKTSRAIAAQILRHRSFKFQEFSQRYAESHDYVPFVARRQDTKNRQNSVDDLPIDVKAWFEAQQHMLWLDAQSVYKEALKRGVAKECCRAVLPLSTATTIYMTGDLRCFMHYVQLRTANGTQQEHMDIANAIKVIMIDQFPTVGEALGWVVK
jgi:thymidylate synthase (FAD)